MLVLPLLMIFRGQDVIRRAGTVSACRFVPTDKAGNERGVWGLNGDDQAFLKMLNPKRQTRVYPGGSDVNAETVLERCNENRKPIASIAAGRHRSHGRDGLTRMLDLPPNNE